MAIMVSSPAFGDQETLPRRFTCDDEGISPPLELAGVPAGTAELVLLVEDPDAPSGTFAHWVVWGIDPGTTRLAAGQAPPGAVQGSNDFRRPGYGGPCPPPGRPHRYQFIVYALSGRLDLPEGAYAAKVKDALAGKVLATGTLTTRYGR